MVTNLPAPPLPPRVLLARDLGDDAVRAGRRTGRLTPLVRGAYLPAPLQGSSALPADGPAEARGSAERRRTRVLALCVAFSGRLTCEYAFAFTTAALIHGCWLWSVDDAAHIIQTTRPSSTAPKVLRRHVAALPPGDVTEVNGLRVTTLERTIEDCARTMGPRAALAVADSGLRILTAPDRRRRWESEQRIEAVRRRLLDRLDARPGVRGAVRARAVIAHADGFAESPGETDLRWVALSRGLPRPVCQLAIDTLRGRYYVDVGWVFESASGPGPDVLALEYDGQRKYEPRPGASPGAVLRAEKVREDAIRDAGVRVQRYGFEDLRDPDGLFMRIARGVPAHVLGSRHPVPGLQVLARPAARPW